MPAQKRATTAFIADTCRAIRVCMCMCACVCVCVCSVQTAKAKAERDDGYSL